MDLQSIFYVLAIIFMLLSIGILLSLIYLMWYIAHSAQEMKKGIEEKAQEFISSKKSEVGGIIGMAVAGFILKKARDWFAKKNA